MSVQLQRYLSNPSKCFQQPIEHKWWNLMEVFSFISKEIHLKKFHNTIQITFGLSIIIRRHWTWKMFFIEIFFWWRDQCWNKEKNLFRRIRIVCESSIVFIDEKQKNYFLFHKVPSTTWRSNVLFQNVFQYWNSIEIVRYCWFFWSVECESRFPQNFRVNRLSLQRNVKYVSNHIWITIVRIRWRN